MAREGDGDAGMVDGWADGWGGRMGGWVSCGKCGKCGNRVVIGWLSFFFRRRLLSVPGVGVVDLPGAGGNQVSYADTIWRMFRIKCTSTPMDILLPTCCII